MLAPALCLPQRWVFLGFCFIVFLKAWFSMFLFIIQMLEHNCQMPPRLPMLRRSG